MQQLFVTLHAKMVAIAINLVSAHVRMEQRAQDVNMVSHITDRGYSYHCSLKY